MVLLKVRIDITDTTMKTMKTKGESANVKNVLKKKDIMETASQLLDDMEKKCFAKLNEQYQQLQALSLQNPTIRHLKSHTFEELPLHMVSRRGCQFKKEFESLLLDGIRHHVGGLDGFGGFVIENKSGQTPLSLLFANTCNRTRENWEWFCHIIKLAVEQDFTFSAKNDVDSVLNIPLLHAALDLGSPTGLINRILLEYDELTECDSLGRTPLMIATTNNNTSDHVIQTLIQRCRTSVKIKDNKGNLPLHLKIKAGRSTIKNRTNRKRDLNDFNVIAALVQESPESLEVQDGETKLPPFMLASIDEKWTLDVVYGLLRTSPWVITSCSRSD